MQFQQLTILGHITGDALIKEVGKVTTNVKNIAEGHQEYNTNHHVQDLLYCYSKTQKNQLPSTTKGILKGHHRMLCHLDQDSPQ